MYAQDSSKSELINTDRFSPEKIVPNDSVSKSRGDYKVPEGYIRLPTCKSKCNLRITVDEEKKVFESYQQKGTSDSKWKFIYDMTEVRENPTYKKNPTRFRKPYTPTFYLNTKRGRQKICSVCFRLILSGAEHMITDVLNQKWKEMNKSETKDLQELSDETHSFSNEDPVTPKIVESNRERTTDIDDCFRNATLRRRKLTNGWQRLPSCTKFCHLKVSADDQKCIYETYWQRATVCTREKFIYDMIETVPLFDPSKISIKSSRKFHTNYYLNTDKGIQKVCRLCFIFALGESKNFIINVLKKKWQATENKLKIEGSNNISLSEKDVDSKFVLDQGGETLLSPLENKLQEIVKQENSNLPVETCIVREEADLKNDFEVQTEGPERTAEEMSDFETEDIKIEPSTAQFILVENFVDVSETVQSLEKESINEAPSLLSNVDPLSPEIVDQEMNKFHRATSWTRLSPCANNCYLKIKESDQELIFKSYWQGGTFDSRFSFVYNMTEMIPNTKLQDKLHGNDRKLYDTTFYVDTNEGRQKVCRLCFRLTLGEWDSFITAVLEKKLRAVYKSEESKEKTFQVKKKANRVRAPVVKDKVSKSESNKDLFKLLSFSNGNHLSTKIARKNPNFKRKGQASNVHRDNNLEKLSAQLSLVESDVGRSTETRSLKKSLLVQKDAPQEDSDINFGLNTEIQEECEILSVALKRKFEDIDNHENEDVPKKTFIIKQEYFKNANLEFKDKNSEELSEKSSYENNSTEFELIIVKEERIDY